MEKLKYEPHYHRELKPSTKPKSDPFEFSAKAYDQWFEKHAYAFLSELNSVQQLLPKDGVGIEIGTGTGRFSESCGIKEGVEPSKAMRAMAQKRGVSALNGKAEHLPFGDMKYDFVLIVTICYFQSLPKALKEVHRVLKRKGELILGFIDKDSTIGQEYLSRKKEDDLYKKITLYPVSTVLGLLRKSKFRISGINQTLFGQLEDIQEVQPMKEGYGEGSFIVLKAVKN